MVNDFYTKYKTEIEEIAKNTRKQLLEENIPFWENRILDVEYGGYFNTFIGNCETSSQSRLKLR